MEPGSITVDYKQQTQSQQQIGVDNFVFDPNLSPPFNTDGCWVYLVINSVNLYDEGLYVCQIDTMTSTWVQLNILGT